MSKSVINVCVFVACLMLMSSVACSHEKTHELFSPNEKISCKIWLDENIAEKGILQYSINAHGKEVILPSMFQLTTNEVVYASGLSVKKVEKRSVQQNWTNKLGELSDVPDHYNELKIFLFKDNTQLNFICRIYNEGVAFAFEIPETGNSDSVTIMDEYFSFRFKDDYPCWATYRAQDKYNKVPSPRLRMVANVHL